MKIGANTRYVFLYDATGPMTLRVYNGTAVTTYYYVRNLRGDIIAILNTAGRIHAIKKTGLLWKSSLLQLQS